MIAGGTESRPMRTIIRMQFGSHLYGTATPASDIDVKSVFIPDGRSILLQRAPRNISTKREKVEGEKNFAGEIDEESISLQRYLGLLAEGQTVALDMLFAPPANWIGPADPAWLDIIENRSRLLTKRSAAFVGYCRQQANKYGIKGSRVAAARRALAFLEDAVAAHNPAAKLDVVREGAEAMAAGYEHMAIILRDPNDPRTVDFLEVCGRKLAFPASLASARDTIGRLVDEYGHRALMAERQEGVDWKALSHAVRVATQAIELLSTGHVTFPLPNAAHVLAIKTGQRTYQSVAEEIEQLLVEVEAAEARSALPAAPDQAWIDAFVASTYRREVLHAD